MKRVRRPSHRPRTWALQPAWYFRKKLRSAAGASKPLSGYMRFRAPAYGISRQAAPPTLIHINLTRFCAGTRSEPCRAEGQRAGGLE